MGKTTKKTKKLKIRTQADIRSEFKERAKAAKNKLPFAWINFFLAKYPEYTIEEHKDYINNVAKGASYDEEITHKMEALVTFLSERR